MKPRKTSKKAGKKTVPNRPAEEGRETGQEQTEGTVDNGQREPDRWGTTNEQDANRRASVR